MIKDVIFILGFMFFSVCFTACSEKIGVKHNADNSILLTLDSKSSKKLDPLIKNLSGTEKIFDETDCKGQPVMIQDKVIEKEEYQESRANER